MGFYVILVCTKEQENKIIQDKITEKEINLNISRSSINFIATKIPFLINLTNRQIVCYLKGRLEMYLD